MVGAEAVEVVALFSGLEMTTLAYFTPVGVIEVDLLRVTEDKTLGGTCFMLLLLMTTTLLGFIEGWSVMMRFMGSVFSMGWLVTAGPMVIMLGGGFEVMSMCFCGEPSGMLPSLSANTMGISKMLVFERSGVGGDLMVFIGEVDEGVECPERPVDVRTIVNLVGLKD
ncbi:AAEL008812-PA [Aedes aegypti]|uniref:AAEL008812-PA n=1 Tax=Aedes aegypti TaxID=7159 RepID=Q16XP7_AEDAE|nr:AAEL008812-PA [Aedes aegypti]